MGPRNTNDGLSSKVLPVPIILGLEPPGAVQALLSLLLDVHFLSEQFDGQLCIDSGELLIDRGLNWLSEV